MPFTRAWRWVSAWPTPAWIGKWRVVPGVDRGPEGETEKPSPSPPAAAPPLPKGEARERVDQGSGLIELQGSA